MDRKSRVRMTVILIVGAAIFSAGTGIYMLIVNYLPSEPVYTPGLIMIGVAIVLLASIPGNIKNAHRKADMEDMLDDYQKHKRTKN